MRALAQRLGRKGFSDDPEEVFDELRRASAGGKADYSGISYARIAAEQGVFWPCPSQTHPGTPRLFTEDFPTTDRRAHFLPVEHAGAAELPDADYPVLPHHRKTAAPISVRHADPARRLARRGRTGGRD